MSNGPTIPVSVDGQPLQYVDEYTYLGQLISFKDRTEKEINRRISLSWKAFWALKFILLDKTLSRKTKIQALETCVYPVLLYGCQTWSLTGKHRTKLQTCQRKMMRKIMGVSLKEKIPNATLYQLADTQDITHAAITSKWKWGGHVARLPGDRWTYRATMWDPRIGRRLQGRPRRRWADFFKEQAGQQWSREARDRRKWKLLEGHLCIDRKL